MPSLVPERRRELTLVGWASHYIERLRAGETVSFRPRGHSMSSRIESGQLCTVVPVDPATLAVGDVVLCKVHGNEYLHLVSAIQGNRFQISNKRGYVNYSGGGPEIPCKEHGPGDRRASASNAVDLRGSSIDSASLGT